MTCGVSVSLLRGSELTYGGAASASDGHDSIAEASWRLSLPLLKPHLFLSSFDEEQIAWYLVT